MSLPKEEGSYRRDVDAVGTHDLTGEKLDLELKRILFLSLLVLKPQAVVGDIVLKLKAFVETMSKLDVRKKALFKSMLKLNVRKKKCEIRLDTGWYF